MNNKYFIKTFGCQMNVADSERMSALLSEQGMTPAEDAAEAQVIILNGCTVREKRSTKRSPRWGSFSFSREFESALGGSP